MICKIAVIGFVVLYLIALGLLAIGTFGLFGQNPTPSPGYSLFLWACPGSSSSIWRPSGRGPCWRH